MKQNTFRPRDILNKEVAGIFGVARLTDKARAAHAGTIGSYKYGADSEQDTAILSFLDISAEVFQEAAVRIDNDVKLGAWILDNCSRSSDEISKFICYVYCHYSLRRSLGTSELWKNHPGATYTQYAWCSYFYAHFYWHQSGRISKD